MRKHVVKILIVTAIAALIGLVMLQVQWMKKAHDLIVEDFDQKVSMALCMAVESLEEHKTANKLKASCAISSVPTCSSNIQAAFETNAFRAALTEALQFYQIDLDFKINILNQEPAIPNVLPPNCCPLSPIVQNNDHYIALEFPDKEKYFFDRLGFMLTATILIIGFIALLFGLSIYWLAKQKKITQLNKEFFNHMAHEFRTPITNISLASTLLGSNAKNPEKAPTYLNIITKQSKHLLHQVNSILDFAKLEQGQYNAKMEWVNLTQLIQEVMEDFDLQIQSRQATISFTPPKQPIRLYGNQLHLTNLFRNLIDNALKHNEQGPNIEVDLNPIQNGIEICFKDNGKGMAPTQCKQIFKTFYRVKSESNKGFGIGLAYVKKIMDIHKGSIQVNSALGKGTHFKLFFPTI